MGSNPARSATKYGPDDEFVVLLRTVELRSERRLSPSIMNSSCILACERYRSHTIRCCKVVLLVNAVPFSVVIY